MLYKRWLTAVVALAMMFAVLWAGATVATANAAAPGEAPATMIAIPAAVARASSSAVSAALAQTTTTEITSTGAQTTTTPMTSTTTETTTTPITSTTAATATAPTMPAATLSANATVFARGLTNPRGLAFGPDGSLYVAEAGAGGTQSTEGQCPQVAGAGPYRGSATGSRIVRIAASSPITAGGMMTPTTAITSSGSMTSSSAITSSSAVTSSEAMSFTTFAEGFPSSQTNEQLGSLASGVAGLAFIGDTLYAVTAGSGCSHGVAGTTNGIMRVNSDGRWSQIADLSAYLMQNPTAITESEDFEPDGTWYSMTAMGGALYALEPNHGELVRITQDGYISRVADISDSQGHIVPTAVAFHNGSFYIGNLGVFPASAHSKILRVDRQGNVHFVAGGLTAVTGIAFDNAGQLYALETTAPVTSTTATAPVIPGTGRVVRLGQNGEWEEVATGLMLPTAMAFGPDGYLYVSNFGFGVPPNGMGEIVRIDVKEAK